MTTHKHETGILKLGHEEFQYDYWERDWNILGNTELENLMHTTVNGTCHELIVQASWKVEFPDSKILSVCTIVAGKSFEDCKLKLEDYYRLYQIAQDCPDLESAKKKWYKARK